MVWCAFAWSLHSADTLVIQTEKAASPSGPWTPLQPNQTARDAQGNLLLPGGQPQEYFRTRIDRIPAGGEFDPVPLARVPSQVLKMAEDHLRQFTSPVNTNGTPEDPELWHNAQLGPVARPIYELTILEGRLPAYWEFKVVAADPVPLRGKGGLVITRTAAITPDLGYMIVSATEEDSPVVEFATEGRSPIDLLEERAKISGFKALRYGGSFYAAEDAAGRLLAQLGTEPYRPVNIPLNELAKVITFTGDDARNLDSRMPLPAFKMINYRDYSELRQDYRENPIFQHLLKRRQVQSRAQWGMERGVSLLPQITVNVRASITYTNRSLIRSIQWMGEVDGIARMTINPTNRLLLSITGLETGAGTIKIEDAGGVHYLMLTVRSLLRPLSAGFVPGWKTKKTAYAGNWEMQPKFFQLNRSEFCNLVGCGPVAWGMLFAWFEVNKGIPGAFGNMTTLDATLSMNNNNNTHLNVWRELHELCDVICDPFSDAGATWPGDMMEGGLGYTSIRALVKLINRSWHMEYDLTESGVAEHGLLCRDAILNGYPAVVGLGWLWHYALAYGYKYQEYEVAPGVSIGYRRILKCNMGWGPNEAPRWYNLNDTFFGANFRITKGANSP